MKKLINISILLFLLILLITPSTASASYCEEHGDVWCAEWGRWVPENNGGIPWCYHRWTLYCLNGQSYTWDTGQGPSMPENCIWEYWWFNTGTDADSDGHQAINSCPPGDDCNDNDPTVYPGAREICDGKDNNCDGNTDENCYCSVNNTYMRSSSNLASGNLLQTQDVLNRGGLSFYLSYNSNDIYTGTLGKGWTHNYNINVNQINITQGTNHTYLSLMEGSGQRVYFWPSGGVYYPEANSGEHSTIVPNADGTYTMTTKEGKTYTFSNSGKLTSIKDRNNNTITLAYTDGKLTAITDHVGRVATMTYDALGRIITITDPVGRVTTLGYNANGFLSSVTDPSGNSWQYTYNANGKMLSKIDPRGNTTTYIYDAQGKVLTSTNSSGTKTIAYNQVNNIATVTERDGGVSTSQYDPALNVPLVVTDPQGGMTTYVYDQSRNLTSQTDPLGNTTSYTYDSSGNMISMTDPMDNTITYTYNGFNQVTSITDPMGNITTYSYDPNGNIINTIDPLGNTTSMTYDSHGWLTSTTDPNGNVTEYAYDSWGRMVSVTDPLGGITQYSYTPDDKPSMVTDAKNHSISYGYDQLGRVTTITDQLGKMETYTYDNYGNLITITNRKGQTTIYTYDQLNRIIQTTYADGSSTTYTYDPLGRITTITDSVSGTISYAYSSSGCGSGCSGGFSDKIINETTPLESISYRYDAIGRRTSMTVAGQPTVYYFYDADSRLTGINTTVNSVPSYFDFTYDTLGRITSLTLPNGVTTNYTYDNASRIMNLEHLDPLSQVLESLSYTYEPNGNRTNMNRPSVNLPSPNPASGITYNEANQMLTFIPSSSSAKNMNYDENGNMTSVTNSCGTTTYTWDARNRLIGINGFTSTCTSLTASFEYDALGRRIEKTINGVTTQYLYDGLDIIQEIENGQVTVNYIRTLNIDEPLARIKPDGTVRYYQTDALGAVIALTDENGNVKTTYTYDPFGNTTVSGETSDNPYQYTGRENDRTGLYYYRARYYSPEMQRFISEDQLRFGGKDVIFYAYVKNNPLNFTDPLGLASVSKKSKRCHCYGETESVTWAIEYGCPYICIRWKCDDGREYLDCRCDWHYLFNWLDSIMHGIVGGSNFEPHSPPSCCARG